MSRQGENLFSVDVGPYRYSAPRKLWDGGGDSVLLYVHQDNRQAGMSGKLVRYHPKRRTIEPLDSGLPAEVITAARRALDQLFERGEGAA